MAEFSYAKLVAFLKKHADATQSAAAKELGVSLGQISMVNFTKAQVEAGIYATAPKTGPSVKRLRDSEGNRWELIAARTGLSVAEVKKAYEAAGGDPKASYTGKGRNFAGTPTKTKAAPKAAAKAAPKASGRPSAAKTATKAASGRPSAAKGGRPSVARSTTGRGSRAANPS